MSKAREETKTLDCGCRIGRSKGGPWFYDYLCEIHVPMVYDEEGHYSIKRAEIMTHLLNEEMKRKEKSLTVLEELSETERKAYNFIKEAKQPLPIRDMPHQLQGTIGKLKKKGLVELYREKVQVSKHGFTSMKKVNCVKLRSDKE